MYYTVKPIIPRKAQIALRRCLIRRKLRSHAAVWPICPAAAQAPPGWTGWPDDKKFALVLTHDVDTARGHSRVRQLIEIEERLGFRSGVYFVAERYPVSAELRNDLICAGFEVGVHGLKHDGKMYNSRAIFEDHAARINQYLREWGSCGFRSPAMHHNLDWLRSLDIAYDASTFDTDPFEPQPHGVETIFPFQVPDDGNRTGYIELPYTLPQDWTLFVMMQEKSTAIWRRKLDWLAEHGGMALVISHPDYMEFDKPPSFDSYPSLYYEEFLQYVKTRYAGQYWHVLPREMAQFWSEYGPQNVASECPGFVTQSATALTHTQ
jgi:hypothetical protein